MGPSYYFFIADPYNLYEQGRKKSTCKEVITMGEIVVIPVPEGTEIICE